MWVMRICFIADARTPSPQIWIRHLIREGHEVHLISTYPCDQELLPVASLHVVPLDFSARLRSRMGGAEGRTMHGSAKLARFRGHPLWQALVRLRYHSVPWAVRLQSGRVRRIIERIG